MIEDLRVRKSIRYPSYAAKYLRSRLAYILLFLQHCFCYDGEERAGLDQKPTLRYTLRRLGMRATSQRRFVGTERNTKSILDLVQQIQFLVPIRACPT
jgi:ribosomal protein L30/L7E